MKHYHYDIKKSAARILALRLSHHYTLEQAAQLLHTDADTLRRTELGEIEGTVELFANISQLYDVSVDFLLFEDDGTPQQKEFDRLIAEILAKAAE